MHRQSTCSTVIGIAGALAVALAPGAHADNVRTIEIKATEFAFEPEEIAVEKGETVELKLVNQGQISHNLHMHGVDVKTETIQAGASDSVRFTAGEAGTIRFFCNVAGHREAGMEGDISVE